MRNSRRVFRISSLLTWYLFDAGSISAHPQRGSVTVLGSWMPMALIMGILVTKYAVNATLALHPDLKQQVAFVATVCALYGLFNGVFLGQLLRIVTIYRGGVARSHNFM